MASITARRIVVSNRAYRGRALALCAAVTPVLALAAGVRGQATLYWDINGATANTTSAPNGTWGGTSNWNSASTGTGGAAQTWVDGSSGVFASGTYATTTNYTITVTGPQVASGLVFEDGGTLTFTGTGSITVDPTRGLTLNSTTKATQSTFLVPIGGTGDVTVSNGGATTSRTQVNFTAQNTFVGNLIMTGGTAAAQNRLQMDFGLADPTKQIQLNGSFNEFGTTTAAGTGAWGNAIVLNANNASPATPNQAFIYASGGRTQSISGGISGTNTNVNFGFGNAGGGAGVIVLNSAFTYTGDTYVDMASNGLVQVGVDNALPVNTNLVIGGTSLAAGTQAFKLDLNGKKLTAGSLASNVTGAGTAGIFSGVSGASIVLGGVKDSSYAGTIGASGDAGMSVTKNGAAKQTFTASQGYTGATTVNGGTLMVAGLTSSNVTVAGTGATLGTTAGSSVSVPTVTLSGGGTLAAGGLGGVGALSATTATFNAGSRLSLDWSSGLSFDTLTLGTLNLDGGTHYFDLTLPNGVGSLSAGSYVVGTTGGINWDGTDGFTNGTIPSSNFSFNLTVSGNNLVLNIVPQATTLRWDSDGNGGVVVEGSGVWQDGAGNFTDVVSGAAATWNNAAKTDVIVGGDTSGTAGVIALGSNVTVQGRMTFKPVGGQYTVGDGGANVLTLTTGVDGTDVGIGADNSATINAPVVLGVSQGWAVNGTNTLTVSQGVSQGSGVTATLAKSGSGTLQLNGALAVNALSQTAGVTNVAGGSTISTVTMTGGTLQFANGTNTLGTVSASGGTTTFAGGTTNVTTVTSAAPGVTTFTGGGATVGTLNASGTVTFSAGGNSVGTLNVTTGSTSVNATGNTFGAINLNGGGTLFVGANGALGATPVSMDNGATLRASAAGTVANNIMVGLGGGILWTNTGADSTFSGNVTSAVALVKAGAGVLTLTGTNSYPALTIGQPGGTNSAVVAFGSLASLGTGGTVTILSGGIRPLAELNIPNNVVLAATGNVNNRVDLSSAASTLSGVISGTGDLYKYGSGTLTLAGANTNTGALDIEGGGTIVLQNGTALGNATIVVNADTTLQADTDVTAGIVRGTSVLTKTGPGTVTFGAVGAASPVNNAGSQLVVNQGGVTVKGANALGGNNSAANMAITLNAGTVMTWAFTGTNTQASNVTLNSATLTRATGLASGETTYQNYAATLTLSGNTTIQTSAQQSNATVGQILGFNMGVAVTTGANVMLINTNSGGYNDSNVIGFRGGSTTTDSFTMQAGTTVTTVGPGQVRFGRTSTEGKVIVGQGQPGAEATMRLSNNTYLTDNSAAKEAQLVVAGSGNAGLRIEAPMNATYVDRAIDTNGADDGTTGLFGDNATGTATAAVGTFGVIGSPFTVLSTNRLGALSTPFSGATVGGTMTVAANNATDVVGNVMRVGPGAAAPLTLALDDTASSANAKLTYRMDGSGANGGTIANFAHVQVQQTTAGSGSVKLQLAGNTKITDLVLLNNTAADLTDKALAVESPLATVRGYLATGRNGGAWSGPGINSSVLAADGQQTSTMAIVLGTDLGLSGGDTTAFQGLLVDANTVIVKPAYYGDINLDGRVDADDYALMDRSVAKGLPANWVDGDFDGSGGVTAQDYFLMDRAFGLTHGNVLSPGLLAGREAQFGVGYVTSLVASVPEPGCLGGVVAAGVGVMKRRRRVG